MVSQWKKSRSKATRQGLRSRVSVKNTKLHSAQSHFCPLLSKITLPSQFFASGGQSTGVSASASVLPMNIQEWFALGWTGWISLQSKGLSRVFSNTTVQKHQFFGAQLSLYSDSHIHTWLLEITIALTRWTFVSKVISLLFNMLSRFVIAFLPRSKHLLISSVVVINFLLRRLF